MQEAELIEVSKQMYAAFGRGDIPSLLEHVADDAVWTVPGPDTVAACGEYHGREGVASFFSKVGETMKFDVFEPRDFVATGNRVVALGRMAGTIISTGKPFGYEWAMAFTFRDGKLATFREYYDTANLIEASRP